MTLNKLARSLQTGVMKKNVFVICTLASLVLSMSACNHSDKKKDPENTDPEPSAESKFIPYEGTWKENGTGVVFEIDKTTLTTYNHNSFGCVEEESHHLSDIENLADRLSLSNNTLLLENMALTDNQFEKLNSLPETCQQSLNGVTDAETNFRYFWHAFDEYYAFFEERAIDWQAVYDQYSSLVDTTTSEEELQVILAEIIEAFNDSHVSITDDQEFEENGIPFKGLLVEVHRSFLADEEADDPLEQLIDTHKDIIDIHLLGETRQSHTDSSAFTWGKLSGDIGYLRVDRLSDLRDDTNEASNMIEEEALERQDLAFLQELMPQILMDIADTQGLIIDLRFNFGGNDVLAKTVAEYFNTMENRIVGEKFIRNKKHTEDSWKITLAAQENAYTKPVKLITGSNTNSAAEFLTMALKALPQVEHYGETTLGSVSSELPITLPNGWLVTLSNEVFTNHEGQAVEVTGNVPDTEMPAYSSWDLIVTGLKSDSVIDYAVMELGGIPDHLPQLDQVEEVINETLSESGIPAISVAVITGGKIVFEKGFGFADLENQLPASEHTPYGLGSVSKTFIGTSMAQLKEQRGLDLDKPVSDMNLGFTLANPYQDNTWTTLRRLATHTGGIADSEAYGCSYYLLNPSGSDFQQLAVNHQPRAKYNIPLPHAAGSFISDNDEQSHSLPFQVEGSRSFYNAIFNETVCPEGLPIDLGEFLREYLSPDGELITEDNYADYDRINGRNISDYSNVGAGLAGYAIEKELGINLGDHIKTNILVPLAMTNTAITPEELSEDNPMATRYTMDEDGEMFELPLYSYPTRFDGALISSAHDLANYLLAITQGGELNGVRILEPNSADAMLDTQSDWLSGEFDRIGYFWHWMGAYVGHSGGDPGVNTFMQYNPYTDVGVVFLSNMDNDTLADEDLFEYVLPVYSSLVRYGLGVSAANKNL